MKPTNFLDRTPWIVNGFAFGASISLFVCFGITVFLTVLKKMELPEHEVLIFTVLFYGIIFFIAHSGVRAGTRRSKALLSRHSLKDFSKEPTETTSAIVRVRIVLWNIITIISVGWVTPVLIIYWAAPRHTGAAVTACCFLFSLAGATAYILKTGKKNKTVYNRLIFFVGVCLGVVGVVRLIPIL